jgi:chloramphenicol 3-O-phosphotransferase
MIFKTVKNSITWGFVKNYFCLKKSLKNFMCLVSIFLFTGVIAHTTNNIIILNGTSSAGKSSIKEELSKILGQQWASFSIDNYVVQEFKRLYPAASSYPDSIDEAQIDKDITKFQSTQVGKYLCGKEPLDKMIQDTKTVLARGKNVIIDITLYGEKFDYLLENLQSYNIKLVMIYCSPTRILDRVECRNQEARTKRTSLEKKLSHRTVTRAIRGFAALYQPTNVENHLGKITRKDLATILDRAVQDFYMADIGKATPSDFAQAIAANFGFQDNDSVGITPIRLHDIVVNNSNDTPVGVAQKIVAQLNLLPLCYTSVPA